MKETKKKFSLKDELFNEDKVSYLSGLIFSVYPDFNTQGFITDTLEEFPKRELMDRIHHIVSMFHIYLPDDYETSLKILLDSLPPELDSNKQDDDFGHFIMAPYSYFVAKYGCSEKYLDISLDALEQMTKRFSSEFAIRAFLNSFEDTTYNKMLEWSRSNNYHVRRFASEGSRPNLPWGNKIGLDYTKTIAILDNLYSDKTRFVTRSVANHLNDISKKDPGLVIDTLKKWKKTGAKDMDYIISHSTRTLVKQGNSDALELLGYSSNPQISLLNFTIMTPSVVIGKTLEFEFDIVSNHDENLIIDYKIYFVGKTGKQTSKVFKIKKTTLDGELHLNKKHPLKLMSTKALYPGKHALEIVINGKSFIKESFELKI